MLITFVGVGTQQLTWQDTGEEAAFAMPQMLDGPGPVLLKEPDVVTVLLLSRPISCTWL